MPVPCEAYCIFGIFAFMVGKGWEKGEITFEQAQDDWGSAKRKTTGGR